MVQDMSEQHYKIVNGERIPMTPEEVIEILDTAESMPEYIANRTGSPESTNRDNVYPSIATQLDILWHDIDNNVFGYTPKTCEFYKTIKAVKDANPKQ